MNWTRHDTRDLIEAAEDRPVMSRWAVATIRRHHHEPGLVGKMAKLENFVTTCSPHVWGQSDCSLVIADWVALNGHPDPGADWRGTYDSKEACMALLERRGGLVAHIGSCAAQIGLRPIHEPEFGCIAVIGVAHSVERQWAAIWQGRRWVVKWGDATGARWMPFAANPLAMWRV